MGDQISAVEKGKIQDTKQPSDSKEPKVGSLECDTESAIILSFTALQLKRIGELQEELLKLQNQSESGDASDKFNNRIDETLERYGK
jgi:hypothetical protein